jgi:hypothetical protein
MNHRRVPRRRAAALAPAFAGSASTEHRAVTLDDGDVPVPFVRLPKIGAVIGR